MDEENRSVYNSLFNKKGLVGCRLSVLQIYCSHASERSEAETSIGMMEGTRGTCFFPIRSGSCIPLSLTLV